MINDKINNFGEDKQKRRKNLFKMIACKIFPHIAYKIAGIQIYEIYIYITIIHINVP